jgi:hypothetical protein
LAVVKTCAAWLPAALLLWTLALKERIFASLRR